MFSGLYRSTDTVVLEAQLHQMLHEWRAELSDPFPASSLQGNNWEPSEMLRLLQLAGTEEEEHGKGYTRVSLGFEYVYAVAEKIKKTANWEVDVQLELFRTDTGANHPAGGLFNGKTLLYSDLKHVILRILPKYLPEAEDNLILVSSHIDTVSTT